MCAHLRLVLELRMSGAIPLLPLYAFMAWARITSPLPFKCVYNVLCSGTGVLRLVMQSLPYDCDIIPVVSLICLSLPVMFTEG